MYHYEWDMETGGFLLVMGREIGGAVLIGVAVSFVSYLMLRRTKDQHRMIFITILAAVLSYYLCELFSCSGAIACVIVGLGFSVVRDRMESSGEKVDFAAFDNFWDTTDVLLNSILYVILGLTFIRIVKMPMISILCLLSIALNFISRYLSILAGSFFIKPLPGGLSRLGFSTLFTWGGLRGGLCIALAMSTSTLVDSDSYNIILGCVYATVFFTTVIQGLTMKKVYAKIDTEKRDCA